VLSVFLLQNKIPVGMASKRPTLKNVDPKLAESILNELVESGTNVSFSDIG